MAKFDKRNISSQVRSSKFNRHEVIKLVCNSRSISSRNFKLVVPMANVYCNIKVFETYAMSLPLGNAAALTASLLNVIRAVAAAPDILSQKLKLVCLIFIGGFNLTNANISSH